MKGTGAKRNVCPGSCVSTGAMFPVAPVESAPIEMTIFGYTADFPGVNVLLLHLMSVAQGNERHTVHG